MNSRSQYLPLVAFWACGVIWGSNFIYMKMATNLISPLQIVFFRVLFGFIPVLIYAQYCKALRLEHLRCIGHFFVMGLLATVVNYFCFVKGTSLLLSGIAGAVSGAIPLFTFLLAVLFIDEEKTTALKLIGIVVGFTGVAIIGRPSGAELQDTNLVGVLYMVLGSLSVGASFVYAKKFIVPLKIPAVALTAYQLGCGLLVLAIFTNYDGIDTLLTDKHTTVGLIVGLGVLGTGLAYIIYYYIVEKMGAVTASSVTYIPPVVALVIGAVLVGEPIAHLDYVATVLIFVGVVLLRGR